MKNKKIALITGITGQDGSYLSRLLLQKGYEVHGLQRRASLPNTERIDDISQDITLHYGDVTDSTNILRIINETQPDEIYNLAAQSHVKVSFETPEYTANTDALGALRILEAIRILNLNNKTRFYQASTSEIYGNATESPQNEETPFLPCSPYAAAKLYAYWITKNYRDAYGIFASNGILFNHESPLRGEDFVTRKITKAVAAISQETENRLTLGNLDAKRDWGHAKDYIKGMWKILNHTRADDFVLATGTQYSVREFVEMAFRVINIEIVWKGKNLDEVGIDKKTGKTLVQIDHHHFRKTELNSLCGDATKAQKQLGWHPETSLKDLVTEMVQTDIKALTQ